MFTAQVCPAPPPSVTGLKDEEAQQAEVLGQDQAWGVGGSEEPVAGAQEVREQVGTGRLRRALWDRRSHRPLGSKGSHSLGVGAAVSWGLGGWTLSLGILPVLSGASKEWVVPKPGPWVQRALACGLGAPLPLGLGTPQHLAVGPCSRRCLPDGGELGALGHSGTACV